MSVPEHNEDGQYFGDGSPVPDDPVSGDAGHGDVADSRKGKEPKLAEELLTMAEADYRLIKASDGRTYATPKQGPNIAVPLGSKKGSGIRARLAASLRRRTNRVATASALNDCINVLEGEAAELDPEPVFVRMGRHENALVVDMGTETGTCIVIDESGWRLEAVSPVVFRRSELIHPLPEPLRDGSLDGLRDLINLSDEDFHLAIGWVVAAYITDIPHPILLIQGEQGTAKSNLIRSLLALVDPQPAADREPPSSQRDWAIFARASWAFSFDNVTGIPDWLSNSLCKGVTGDAVLQRALYSDDDIAVFSFQRVIAMTTVAITSPLAGDLVDRMLLVEPDVLDVRLTDSQVRHRRQAALPAALGAVLDLVSAVLAELPRIGSDDLPRMADFARVLAALDNAAGWNTLATYKARITAMSMTLIEGNTFAHALYRLATMPATDGLWEGTAAQLLAALRDVCEKTGVPVAELPANVQALGVRLSQVAPSLRKVGVDIRRGPRAKHRRTIIIRHVPAGDTS